MNIELVKDYYGKTLRGSDDLKTKACCTPRPLEITDPEVEEKIGAARFYSATYRLFKIDGLETACEDYGQAVIYRGGVPDALHVLALDSHHTIEKGRIIPVCGNTWKILKESRFAAHFDFLGDFSTHYGIFPRCGTNIPFDRGYRSCGFPYRCVPRARSPSELTISRLFRQKSSSPIAHLTGN